MADENPLPPPIPDEPEDMPTIAGLKRNDLVLGRFKLERCLGRGGMGEVWLAHDETLEEKLALKLLPRLIHFDERAVDDLKNETRRGRQLSHPNIVRVFDFYKDSQNVGIAMEFVNGENLAVLHAREHHGVFSVERITAWVRQLLGGLDYAHRSGSVVHRDLKPANLLIDTGTQALKIADFGIARCVADSMQKVTMSALSRGTLCYMSPEQAMGRGPNPLDDLYAVGATLYELLAGTPPFYTGDITSQIQKVPPPPIGERQKEQGFYQPPPAIWEQVIMRCLAKERAQRPQSAAEVLEALGLGTGAAAMPYHLNTGAFSPPTLPVISPPTLPVAATSAPMSMSTGSPGNTGSIAVSTSATVLTVPTQTQRTLDLKRSGSPERIKATVIGGAELDKKPSNLLLPLAAAALIVLLMLAGGGWWLYQRLNQPKAPALPPVSPAIATEPSPAAPLPAPTPTAPVAGQDWNVPGSFDSLQAALDAVTVDGQKILLSDQQFKSSVTIKRPVHLIGKGADKTILMANGQSGAVIDVREAKGVVIEGIGFQHSGEEALLNGQPVARVQGGVAEFKNCTFTRATGPGLEATAAAQVTLTSCSLTENTAQGARISGGATLKAEDCKFINNAVGVFLQLSGSKGTFLRCEFATNALHGIEASGQASFEAKACQFSSNHQSGCYLIDAGTGASLDDCDITESDKGLQAENGAGVEVLNCRISGCMFGLVALKTGNIKIKDSKIKGQKRSGLVLKSPDVESGTTQITGNIILENSEVGIMIEGQGMNPDVSSNKIGPNGQVDIVVQSGAKGRYSKNTLQSKLEDGHNYYIEPGSQVDWQENIEAPATQ